MKFLKTNKSIVASWLVLGVFGYIVGYFVIKPMMCTWPQLYQFSNDIPYGLYKLLIANVLMLPAIVVAVVGLASSAKRKHFDWTVINLMGIITIALLVIYFSHPIIFPSRGL
jgi:hypothetical protein